jgi:hypothetical protein
MGGSEPSIVALNGFVLFNNSLRGFQFSGGSSRRLVLFSSSDTAADLQCPVSAAQGFLSKKKYHSNRLWYCRLEELKTPI